MNNVRIEAYQNAWELPIHQLVRNVFDEFVAPGYSEDGNRVFYDWISPEKLTQRQKDRVNAWVAFLDGKTVGVIEIRNNNHISLLFEAGGRSWSRQVLARFL